MNPIASDSLRHRAIWFWPVVIAVVAWGAIVVALDPVGDHPQSFDGPGLTVDEAFNTGQGVALVDRLFAADLAGFRKVDAALPDHPPLGRVWIGLCHELAFLASPPLDRQVRYSVACARTASATAFAALVILVGVCAGRWYGDFAGAAAALALVLMPRMFGHAHLAALESAVNLTCTAAVLYLAGKWSALPRMEPSARSSASAGNGENRGPALVTAAIGGALLGLALLTKVQAVLLPVPVFLWALYHFRRRAIGLLAVWGFVGWLVFVAGWPYLWSDPVSHLQQYLGRTTNRAVLYVWYFGQVLADRDVPWHYPWVMFLATVPIGLHVLGGAGVFGPQFPAWKGPRERLLLACLVFPLLVFSVPGVAVYDGERLFSTVFPLWAVFIGRGAAASRNWLSARRSPRVAYLSVGVLLAAQAYGLFAMAPCWLSYYNLAVGGLRGAAKLGLEVSYWGDGVTRTLLKETAEKVPAGESIAVAPVLYDAQWNELLVQSPILKERNLRLVPVSDDAARKSRYLLMFVRPEYLPEELRGPIDPRSVLAAVRRQGVALALLLERAPSG